MDTETEAKVSTGRNGVAKLAIRLLSIIANSAGCERTFSKFGIVHTKHRNRLSPQKVHKAVLVQTALQRSQTMASRTKRQLSGHGASSSTSTPPTGSTATERAPSTTILDDDDLDDLEFRSLGAQLIEDAEIAAREEQPELTAFVTIPTTLLPASSPHNETISGTSSTEGMSGTSSESRAKTEIPLRTLFQYPDSLGDPGNFEFFWRGGNINLQGECNLYERTQAPDM